MRKIVITLICLAIIVLILFYYVPPNLKDAYKILPGTSPATTTSTKDSENFSSWQEFIPRTGLFRVMFPFPPQYAKDLVAIPNSDKKRRYEIYASEKIDGTLFLISVITYPSEVDTSDSNEILQQVAYELVQNKPGNRLTKLKESFFNGYPSLDFSIENQQFHIEGKMILVNKTVYVLSYSTRLGDFDPKEYQYFIDSFELFRI
jgi:hypothetical protein